MSNLSLTYADKNTDFILAGGLMAAGVFGFTANIMSCYCFYKIRERHRNNSIYFKAVYMMVTIVDCLICVIQLPVVEGLIAERRGVLFGNTLVCHVWVVLWRSLMITTIFLVAQLSISRLVLLAKPFTEIRLYLIWLPLGFMISVAAVICGALARRFITMQYFPTFSVQCITLGSNRGDFNYLKAFVSSIPVPFDILKADLRKSLLSTSSIAIPFLPILISFAASLFYLNKVQRKGRSRCNSSSKPTRSSRNTVIFVTMMYLICNIPTVIFFLIRVMRLFAAITEIQATREPRSLHEITRFVNPTYIEKFYFRAIVEVVFVVINSTLNPLVYLWRIENMRSFVLEKIIRIKSVSN